MAIVGSTFNIITYCSSLMAVGLCADYATHITHYSEFKTPWSVRVRCAVQSVGYNVGHGCLTALLCACCLMWGAADAFRVFALNAMVVTVGGGLLTLFGMPATVSLISTLLQGDPSSRVFEFDKSSE